MFDLGSNKQRPRSCLLIHAFLSDNGEAVDAATSFCDILEHHDRDLFTKVGQWTKGQLTSALRDSPPAFLAGADGLPDLRERYAFFLWASAAGAPSDYEQLPAALQTWAYNLLGVPNMDPSSRAGIAAIMSGKKLRMSFSEDDDVMELDDGDRTGPSRRGRSAGTSAAHDRRSGNDAGGGDGRGHVSPPDGGRGRASPARGNLTSGPARARRRGRSSGGGGSDSESDSDTSSSRGRSLWDRPLPEYPSLSQRERGSLSLARSKLLSLRISISLLTTKDELKSIRDATKLTGDAHEKDVLRRLFRPWPWNQPLCVDDMHSFRPARLGRALMNSLRTITEDFKEWTELQQRTLREEALAKVHARIDSAISSGSKADLLVAFGEVREYAQRVLAAEVSQAERNYGDFPFPEFKEVFDGRQRQLLSCPTFFDEISRRFRNESGRKQLDEQES